MRTVFVVGAGASLEFKGNGTMPIGSELAVQIEQLINEDFERVRSGQLGPLSSKIARHYGDISPEHISAMTRIRNGIQSKNSIDDFIDEWADMPHLQSIAKMCIAECILRAEKSSKLASLKPDAASNALVLRELRSTWLGIIVRSVNPRAPRRDVAASFEGVSFVTFNYDRCIETYLYHNFVSTLGLSDKTAREAIKSVPIYHVYGDLGDVVDFRAYGTPFGDTETGIASSDDIKTYSEEVGSDQQRNILELTREADRIVFLGCAYHPQNLRLVLGGYPKQIKARVWGTALALPGRKLQAVQEYFASAGVSSQLLSSGCSDLLNNYEEEIFEDAA